jgi:CRISPR/Cas system-associated endonuclease Cas1
MAILPTDKRYRGSLAHDVMEPVRPVVDGFVIDLVATQSRTRGEVYETREGVYQIGPALARTLAAWGPAVRDPYTFHGGPLNPRPDEPTRPQTRCHDRREGP